MVRCGDVVRLEHVETRKNLHSHDVRSPLSNKYEVSAFGNDGNGDDGDNWMVICEKNHIGDPLKGMSEFHLQNAVTKRYLFANRSYMYNVQNCGRNCPIEGQLEVSCDSYKASSTKWIITSVNSTMIEQENGGEGDFKGLGSVFEGASGGQLRR